MTKKPPHSMEAEQGFLGSILIDGNTQRVRESMDVVAPEMFYIAEHQEIYRVMLTLKEIDLLTVTDKLDDPDGTRFSYVGTLARNTPSAANIKSYAEIIKDRWIKREVIGIAHNLADMGYNGEDNKTLVEEALKHFERIDTTSGYEPQYLHDEIDSWYSRMQDKADGKLDVTGLKTGIKGIDDAIGGIKKDWLITLAGRAGMGKTLVSQLIAAGMSNYAPVMFFSMEMSKAELTDRFMSLMAGLSQKSLKSGLMTREEVERANSVAMDMKSGGNKIIYDETPGLSHRQIASRVREAKKREGSLSMVIIDYIGLMEMPKAERSDLQIQVITKSLKRLAKELQIPILMLAQANRGADHVQRPSNAHLWGGTAIEADSDLVMFVYREETRNPDTALTGVTEIIPTKFRHGTFHNSVYITRNPHSGMYYTMSRDEVDDLKAQDDTSTTRKPRSFSEMYGGKK